MTGPDIPFDALTALETNDARWLFIVIRQQARDTLRRQQFAEEWLAFQARAWSAAPEAIDELKVKGFLEPAPLAGHWRIPDRYWQPPAKSNAERQQAHRDRRRRRLNGEEPSRGVTDDRYDAEVVEISPSRDVTPRNDEPLRSVTSRPSPNTMSRKVTADRDPPLEPPRTQASKQASFRENLACLVPDDPEAAERIQVIGDFAAEHLGRPTGLNAREQRWAVELARLDLPPPQVEQILTEVFEDWRRRNAGDPGRPPTLRYFLQPLELAAHEHQKRRPATSPIVADVAARLGSRSRSPDLKLAQP